MRLSHEELEVIKQKHNTNELWSFSKVHTYLVSPYSYYLKYIKHEKEIDKTGIYSESGAAVHSIMEKLYTGQIKYEDMLAEYEQSLVIFGMAELKYNKSDAEKNAKIANRYEDNIRHYLKHHQQIQGLTKVEEFVITKVGPYVFQGYCDMIGKQGTEWTIYDFKTSTKYTGDKIQTEASQLLLYAQSLIQHGIPVEHIHCCWDFCKYTNVSYMQKNGSLKERTLERCEIGSSLAASVKTKMKDAKYTTDAIDAYINALILSNDINTLPPSIAEQYTFTDCLVYVPLTQELLDDFNNHLLTILQEITDKTIQTSKSNSVIEQERLWWDTPEQLKANEYYHCNLSGYTREQHKPWNQYLQNIEAAKQAEGDIFASSNNKTADPLAGIDLSWMNNYI